MKKLIPFLCLFFTMSVSAATLEGFFGTLEGKWEMVWGQSTAMDIRSFSANVVRTGNTWNFSEYICNEEPQGEVICGTSSLTYEIINDGLYVTMGEERAEVYVQELWDDFIVIMFEMKDFNFTGAINRRGTELFQDALIEYSDGSTDQHFLHLEKR